MLGSFGKTSIVLAKGIASECGLWMLGEVCFVTNLDLKSGLRRQASLSQAFPKARYLCLQDFSCPSNRRLSIFIFLLDPWGHNLNSLLVTFISSFSASSRINRSNFRASAWFFFLSVTRLTWICTCFSLYRTDSHLCFFSENSSSRSCASTIEYSIFSLLDSRARLYFFSSQQSFDL